VTSRSAASSPNSAGTGRGSDGIGVIIALVVQQSRYAPRAHPAVTEVELNYIKAGGALVDMDAAPSARPIPGEVPGGSMGCDQAAAAQPDDAGHLPRVVLH